MQRIISSTRPMLLSLATFMAVGVMTVPSDAAVLDWLFPRRRAARRQVYLVNGAPATYAPYSAYYGGWAPSATPYAWYAPQTNYRSVVARVPVTTYRPVGVNSLQPCTTCSTQVQRVPVTAFQPVIGTTVAPACGCATPNCGCAASTCAAPSCGGCDATTTYYGTTPAFSEWQTVAPSTGNLAGGVTTAGFQPSCNCSVGGVTTAGYTPSQTADYAHATPWQSAASAGGGTDWQPVSGPTMPSTSAGGGASEWQPVENYGRSTSQTGGAIEPTPADRAPSLRPHTYADQLDQEARYEQYRQDRMRYEQEQRNKSRPELDNTWQRYDGYDPPNDSGATTRTQLERPLQGARERFVPFQRPIPNSGDSYNWDFDDKFQLRGDRPQRTALRSASRWEAIPVKTTRRGMRSRLNDAMPRPTNRAPRRPANEGGWQSR